MSRVVARHRSARPCVTPFTGADIAGVVRRLPWPALAFALLALVMGGSFISAYGPLSVPDADMHVPSTYALATGQWRNATEDRLDEAGNGIRVQPVTGDSTVLTSAALNADVSTYLSWWLHDDTHDGQYDQLTASPHTVTVYKRSNQYPPVAYIPQGLGLLLARLAGLDGWGQLQLARTANLLWYIVAGTVAVALAGRGARSLLVVSLANPISMYLAASLSADASVIVLGALVVALYRHAAVARRPLPWSALAVMMVAGSLLVPFKLCYAPMALLPLLLPRSVVSLRRRLAVVTGSVVLGLVPYLIWSAMYGRVSAIVDIAANVHYVFSHPLRTAMTVLASSLNSVWVLASQGVMAVVAMMVVAVFVHELRRGLCVRSAVFAGAVALACVMLSEGALMVTWNQPAEHAWGYLLEGMQERYLLPLLPLLAVALPVASGGAARSDRAGGARSDDADGPQAADGGRRSRPLPA